MVSMRSTWLVVAGISGAIAVGMGAYGAHGLSDALLARGFDKAAAQARIEQRYEPAVLYHLVHSVALALVGALSATRSKTLLSIAGGAFLAGVLLFSGLLYLLTFADYSALGAVVPLGGLAYIVGWVALAISGAIRSSAREGKS